MSDIIAKLEKAKLLGRGGAAFPTHLKWQMVKDQKAETKYIVANGSEGEPATAKDAYIVEHYPELLIEGLSIALTTIDHSSAFIFLRRDYFKKYKTKLEKLIADLPIKVVAEKGGYLSGEETMVCQEIENGLLRPRHKPPFPGQAGIFGYPTLINNIETFYYVAQIAQGKYNNEKMYTISGDTKNPGVYELPTELSIKEILKQTNNYPTTDFFVQVGGGASGEILLAEELDKNAEGSGAIIVYDKKKTDPYILMDSWIKFFMAQNCDKCTPCREGTYRLAQMIKDKTIDKAIFDDLLFVLENTSFCALGKMVVTPFRSLADKILKL
ncbi:hypothetical protein C4566_01370 [Candidatus Parcubacteria bacterium]|nr:MAG: hypothetical protein C4566_01370 [Candidatus Parcubacteria bacterium]